jgi:hypothetical protein
MMSMSSILYILLKFCRACLFQVVTVSGYVLIAYVLFTILRWLYTHFGPAADLSKYGAKTGAWAVVTGATDGIGYDS